MKLEYRVFGRDVKASGSDVPGQFTGKASVYGVVDSYGDVVMPGAFAKTLADRGNRIKVLAQHDPSAVIGIATLTDSSDALLVTDGRLVLDLPEAKDMYTRLTNGLLDGISIGYVTKNSQYDKGVRQLTEIELWEVSLVTFPANDYARVTGIKSEIQDPFVVVDRLIDELKRFASLELKAGAQFSAANAAKITAAYDAVVSAQSSLQTLKDAIDAGNGNGDNGDGLAGDAAKAKGEAERLTLKLVSETLEKLIK